MNKMIPYNQGSYHFLGKLDWVFLSKKFFQSNPYSQWIHGHKMLMWYLGYCMGALSVFVFGIALVGLFVDKVSVAL